MFNPKPRASTFIGEQETRNMVAFIEHLDEIKEALAQLDKARVDVAEAEASAKEVSKQADIRIIEVNRYMDEAVGNQKAFEEVVAAKNKEADEKLMAATELAKATDLKIADVQEKDKAFKTLKRDLEAKKEELAALEEVLWDKEANLNKREDEIEKREKKYAKVLEALN